MSNIRKSFSFRDGIQVDSDDLIVRGNLVGIGTTIPTERLDVRGTAKVVGLVTTQNVFVTGIGTFNKVAIGTNISITGGIVTASAFYGDGATLSNLPTSQWVDVDVGLGFTSIYAAGNVGIATLDPRNTFQVGANPNVAGRQGVGINSTGDIKVSGVVTASYYYGSAQYLTGITAENIQFGTISNTRLPVLAQDRFPTNLVIAGILTAQGGFIGTVTGQVVGNVVGIASFASGLTGTPNIQVGIISATKIRTDSIEVLATPNAGVSTVAFKFQVGSGGTSFTATDGGRVGIGTTEPQTDFQILKNTKEEVTTVEIVNIVGESRIAIGNSVGIGNSIGIIRYGNTPGSFDIINKSTGGITFYNHTGASGVNTRPFSWVYGQTNTTLATLTYNGYLGIGKTNPNTQLDVVGSARISQDGYVNGNFEVLGTLSYGSGSNKVILGGGGNPILNDVNIYSTTGVSTFNGVNVIGNSRIGIGTDLPATGLDARTTQAWLSSVGIGTTIFASALAVNGSAAVTGSVGIGTTVPQTAYTTWYNSSLNTNGLQVYNNLTIFDGDLIFVGAAPSYGGGIGLGTAEPFAALDMRFAKYNAVRSVFYPPTLSLGEALVLTPGSTLGSGAVIYNRNSFTLENYSVEYGWQPAGIVAYNNVIIGNNSDVYNNFTRTAQNVSPVGSGATANTLVGCTVGLALTAGAKYNTFLGDRCGFELSGDNNLCIGYKVGGNPAGTQNYNNVVLIGVGTGGSLLPYSVANGALIPPVNRSKILGIGFNDGSACSYWITGNQSLNIGIGTNDPTSKLHVIGNTLITGITTSSGGIRSGDDIVLGTTSSAGAGLILGGTSQTADLFYNSASTRNEFSGTNTDFYIRAKDYTFATGASGFAAETAITIAQNGAVSLYYDNSKKFETTTAGVTITGDVTDSKGGLRTLPQNSQSTSASAYTLTSSDVGKHVLITNITNGIIVPDDVFTAGQFVVLVNNTTSNCSIDNELIGGAATIRVAGSTSTVLPQVLGAYGVATLLCTASNTFVLYGQGVS